MNVIEKLEAAGFIKVPTGGGCTAMQLGEENGRRLMATGADGCDQPDDTAWMIGIFNDWEDEGRVVYSEDGTDFDASLAAMLADFRNLA